MYEHFFYNIGALGVILYIGSYFIWIELGRLGPESCERKKVRLNINSICQICLIFKFYFLFSNVISYF